MRWLKFAALILTGFGWAQTQQGSAHSYSISLKTTYTEAYMWRGRVLDPETSWQGQLTYGIGSWSYNLFHHQGSDFFDDDFDEYTHSLEYTTVAGNQVRTMGYNYFDYSGTRPDTQEFFFRIAHQTTLYPSYGMSYDIDHYRGYYFDFTLAHPFPLTRRITLNISAEAGVSYELEEKQDARGRILEGGQFRDDGINHASAGIDLVWLPVRRLKVTAGYEFHHAFDDLLKDDPQTGDQNQIWKTTITLTLP